MRRIALFVLPLVGLVALLGVFAVSLNRDPSYIPSVLINKPAPDFALPPVAGTGAPGFDTDALKGHVSIVNVWASWCVPCHDEAPLMLALGQDTRLRELRLQFVGINYKDAADNARRFLGRYGNPFDRVGVDANGRASIDWGVYGVPETFVVGRDGAIAYKLVGPITPDNLETVLKPEIAKALAAGS